MQLLIHKVWLRCFGVFLSLWVSSRVQADELTRFVDFRDGTRLLVSFSDAELPWQLTTPEGEIIHRPLSLEEVEELHLVLNPSSRKLELIRQALRALNSDEYSVREQAQEELIRLGNRFRPLLEQALESGEEVDFRWRVTRILEQLPPVRASLDRSDTLIDTSGASIDGDVADWSPTVTAYGTSIRLNRRTVSSIGRRADTTDLFEGPAVGLVQRVLEDDSDHDSESVVRIDFETSPDGRYLNGGDEVGKMYVPWGCVLETSYAESRVTLESGFSVHGPSGGLCAANLEPKYRGVMTIRFCDPGHADAAAGVRYVGLWLATVKPRGTTLEAYDVAGRLLISIQTMRRGTDFLAVRSAVPIAYMRVVPNENRGDRRSYDPNFAIDDLSFDSPTQFSESGESEYFTVLLKNGESLRGRRMHVEDDTLQLNEMSVGIEEVKVPTAEVRALIPPFRFDPEEANQHDFCLVMLEDGSVLRAMPGQDGLRAVRVPNAELIAHESIVALWGASTTFLPPPSDWEGASPIVMNLGDAIPLQDVRLGPEWIEADELDEISFRYADSPPVWFRERSPLDAADGRLRLVTGEEFVLAEGAFELKDWNHERVTISDGENAIVLPLTEIVVFVMGDAGP